MESLFSVEEAAKALGGVSPLTVAGWCAKGRLARTKVGRRTMISESAIRQFIADSNPPELETTASVAVFAEHAEMCVKP